MFPLVLLAKIEFTPGPLLRDPGVHELAHDILRARLLAEREEGFFTFRA